MIIGVIGDNLGGGSARIGEAIINGLIADINVTKVIAYSNSRVSLPTSAKINEVNSSQLKGFSRVKKRMNFVSELPNNAIVLNLTNFPIGFRALSGRQELVLLHNAYFFRLPEEVSFLRSPLFVVRNSYARMLILRWQIFFSSPKNTIFMVQSEWMYKLARKSIPLKFDILVIRPHQWLRTKKHDVMLPANSSLYNFPDLTLETCWFYPATGEKHKNHILLLDLFKAAIEVNPDIKLILTLPLSNFDSKNIMRRVYELGIEKSIINVGWICRSDKDYLMQNTCGVIFLSRFESLGLPLLEIRDLGRPSLVLDSEIAREVLGNDHNFYDLFSDDLKNVEAEHRRFSNDLAFGINGQNSRKLRPNIGIEQAYFFDALVREK